ncbi:MAG: hypothetical protein FJ299_14550, partial [Planctomycetes bacterium]|nr:hypothetical protein [Planctomycetota bacterium]
PSAAYLKRFPPRWVIAFGRSLQTRATVDGLARELAELREQAARAGLPRPAVCCDLEEGAGLHFPEATRLAPALALAAADAGGDGAALFVAGELTAREARALGVELVLAPVVDVNTRRDNPIIATRSFGDEPDAVARRARAWLDGLARGGALGCLKHFPGHGDTEKDSHTELPLVAKTRAEFDACELVPYRELLTRPPAALGAVMVAHLDVPALTAAPGEPTSLSRRAVGELLRGELGWDGLVMTDGLAMGALARQDDFHARALSAGCDLLLGPPSAERAAEELLAALRRGVLARADLERAAARAERLAERALSEPSEPASSELVADALALAQASIVLGPGGWSGPAGMLQPVHGPAADPLLRLEPLTSAHQPAPGGMRVFAAACLVGCGRGRAGLEAEVERELVLCIERELARGGRAGLLWFGSPQVLPEGLWGLAGLSIALCHAPSEPLQRAAAAGLRESFARTRGRLPVAQPEAGPVADAPGAAR